MVVYNNDNRLEYGAIQDNAQRGYVPLGLVEFNQDANYEIKKNDIAIPMLLVS
jgi:hypothetical protein